LTKEGFQGCDVSNKHCLELKVPHAPSQVFELRVSSRSISISSLLYNLGQAPLSSHHHSSFCYTFSLTFIPPSHPCPSKPPRSRTRHPWLRNISHIPYDPLNPPSYPSTSPPLNPKPHPPSVTAPIAPSCITHPVLIVTTRPQPPKMTPRQHPPASAGSNIWSRHLAHAFLTCVFSRASLTCLSSFTLIGPHAAK